MTIVSAIQRPLTKQEVERFHNLERDASLCKIATKIANCICLPVSCACCIAHSLCDSHYFSDYNPETGIDYSQCTSCDAGECWSSRLPPESHCDQICQIFDPFFFCCSKETSAHYLSPEKQRLWRLLGPQVQTMAPEDQWRERPVRSKPLASTPLNSNRKPFYYWKGL